MNNIIDALGDSVLEVAPPVRILVQTITRLVPGDLYPERVRLMRNIICQHHWNRDFDCIQERFQARGADFGFDNRVCYFLLDSGINLDPVEDPPILWYRWTGESLLVHPFSFTRTILIISLTLVYSVTIHKVLPTEILDRLREYPFQKPPSDGSRKLHVEPDAAEKRRIIKARLYRNMPISESTIEFLRDHPEQATKLKDDLEPRFWSKLEALAKSHQGGYRPILARGRAKRKNKG